jgi:hypothetical protein
MSVEEQRLQMEDRAAWMGRGRHEMRRPPQKVQAMPVGTSPVRLGRYCQLKFFRTV